MKLNSLLLYVSDLNKSSDFYRSLGFEISNNQDYVDAKLNDFTLRLLDKNKAHFKQDSNREPKGTGVFIYVEVDNIDQYFNSLKEKGMFPSSEPRNWPWGNREFALRDPDSYKLIFSQKL